MSCDRRKAGYYILQSRSCDVRVRVCSVPVVFHNFWFSLNFSILLNQRDQSWFIEGLYCSTGFWKCGGLERTWATSSPTGWNYSNQPKIRDKKWRALSCKQRSTNKGAWREQSSRIVSLWHWFCSPTHGHKVLTDSTDTPAMTGHLAFQLVSHFSSHLFILTLFIQRLIHWGTGHQARVISHCEFVSTRSLFQCCEWMGRKSYCTQQLVRLLVFFLLLTFFNDLGTCAVVERSSVLQIADRSSLSLALIGPHTYGCWLTFFM